MDIWKKENFVKKILFLVIICALFAPFQAGRKVRAEALRQATVTITAQGGLRGFCKANVWLPIHVTVENTGADVDARVQASYKNSGGGQTISAIDIPLPATSRKEFFLYIMPEGFMRGFTVSVLDGNKTLAKTNLNISCDGDPTMLFGILADTPSNYTMLNDVEPLADAAQTIQLKITDLPDQAQGWEMLDALIISNVDTGTLSDGQKQALEAWLADGGKLFVTGGVQWQSTAAGLDDLLPIQPTSTKKAGLAALSTYAMDGDSLSEFEATLSTGKLQAGANILVEQDGLPLLVEKEIGFGKVYYFAADPGLNPLNDWDGMRKIYEHLLAFKTPKPTWAYGVRDSYAAGSALATLPELALPSFIYICCWLGLYIVIIGPVNYFVLRRFKRTELAWVTVPVLVIIFTSLAYVSGYAYRGTKPIMNRIMLAQGWQGVDKAQVTALVGVYSPTRTTYNVESQEQFLISPLANENVQGNSDWLSIKQDSGNLLSEVRVEIGGMKSLAMEGYLPAPTVQHDLVITLSNTTPTLKGSVTNASPYTLEEAVLVTPNGWQLLGNLTPNDSKKIDQTLVNSNLGNTTQYGLINLLGWDTYQTEDIVERRRSSFLQAVTNYNGNISANSDIYLMAWVDGKIKTPASLQGEEPNVTDTMLYFQKLTPEVNIKAGQLMLASSLYHWESSLGDSMETSLFSVPSDGYSLRFRPTTSTHFSEVDSLQFSFGTNNTPQQIHPSIWNFQTEAWQPFNLDAYGMAEIPEAEQCLGMDGEILLNIQGDPNSYFDITFVDFTMMVQP